MNIFNRILLPCAGLALAAALLPHAAASETVALAPPPVRIDGTETTTNLAALSAAMKVGDVVFIRIGAKPFREVADATDSWTNHVGIVVGTDGPEPLIGESAIPWSRTTTLSKFVARSEGGRVAVSRLHSELTSAMQQKLLLAVDKRSGVHYDTGFNLHSRGQFCSRFVREVLIEATGTPVGEVETFAHLLSRKPGAHLGFWKLWYFGRIPWERETVTPASMLLSPALRPVFDGVASASNAV